MSIEHPVEVPHGDLDPATLRAVVEAFLTREGTDYGAVELTLEQKVDQALGGLRRGDAFLVWEANTETVRVVGPDEIAEVRAMAGEPQRGE